MVIQGTSFSGKTTLTKHLQDTFAFHVVDFEKISTYLKEKLGGEEAAEEIPFEAYCKYFHEEIGKLEEG